MNPGASAAPRCRTSRIRRRPHWPASWRSCPTRRAPTCGAAQINGCFVVTPVVQPAALVGHGSTCTRAYSRKFCGLVGRSPFSNTRSSTAQSSVALADALGKLARFLLQHSQRRDSVGVQSGWASLRLHIGAKSMHCRLEYPDQSGCYHAFSHLLPSNHPFTAVSGRTI
jgi:hypothetical protein